MSIKKKESIKQQSISLTQEDFEQNLTRMRSALKVSIAFEDVVKHKMEQQQKDNIANEREKQKRMEELSKRVEEEEKKKENVV